MVQSPNEPTKINFRSSQFLSSIFLEVHMAGSLCMFNSLLSIHIKTIEIENYCQAETQKNFSTVRTNLLTNYTNLAYPTAQSEVGSVCITSFPASVGELTFQALIRKKRYNISVKFEALFFPLNFYFLARCEMYLFSFSFWK